MDWSGCCNIATDPEHINRWGVTTPDRTVEFRWSHRWWNYHHTQDCKYERQVCYAHSIPNFSKYCLPMRCDLTGLVAETWCDRASNLHRCNHLHVHLDKSNIHVTRYAKLRSSSKKKVSEIRMNNLHYISREMRKNWTKHIMKFHKLHFHIQNDFWTNMFCYLLSTSHK